MTIKKPYAEVVKKDHYVIKDADDNIKQIVFPHQTRIGLYDNSYFGATVSASIHHTNEGKSYLVAGGGITITSGSNGQVTIESSGGSSPTTTQHVHNFWLSFSPPAGSTQTYYGRWSDSSIQNIDPDQTASNFVWKYYPYGGEIKKVYAIGSSRGDSDDLFPSIWQNRDIIFAIYNFEDTDGAGADVGVSTVERVPKYHVTASYSGGDFDLLIARKTGSTTRYKRCGVTFDLSSGTGSTTISAGDAIAFGFKGEDTGRGPFEYMQFFIEWDENIS